MRKKILLFIFMFLAFTINVSAETKTFDRTLLDNYGVNKKWKITDSNINNVLNTPLVDADDKIYDFSDVLTAEEEQLLKDKIEEFISLTNMDVVIVTVDLPYSYDSKNEEYAADFYDYNDFGINFDKYSGILLLRNTYSSDPYYNIYTFGDAQLYYTGNVGEAILDDIYYTLHNEYYVEGFELFVNKLNFYYNEGIPSYNKNLRVDEDGYLYRVYIAPVIPIIGISSIVTLITMLILVSKNKTVIKATEAKEYLKNIEYNRREDKFVSSHTTHYTISSSSGGSSGGGGFSHSGSSGGGHSSGGGRHG